MRFSDFTLSDNAYANNPRSSSAFVADIVDEAIRAERLGMHAAGWTTLETRSVG